MTQATDNKLYNTFIAGLITEASEIAFPKDASVDEVNFTLNADGSRNRRKGVDYESGYVVGPAVSATDASNSYLWKDVAGTSTINFNVVQVGSTLHFYADNANLSGNKKSFTYDLLTHKISTATNAQVAQNIVALEDGNGYLFVAGQYIDPFYISYNAGLDTIAGTTIVIKIRDFTGVDDGLDVDEEPTTLSDNHHYNLTNQGWIDAYISSYYGQTGKYPANSSVWHYGKIVNVGTGVEEFNVNNMIAQGFGNTQGPRGHYIYDAFNQSTPVTSYFFEDLAIASWSYSAFDQSVTMTFSAAHNIEGASATVVISGNSFTWDNGGGCGASVADNLNGTWSATVLSTTSIKFTIPALVGFVAKCSDVTLGTATSERTSYSITSSEDARPRVLAFYAGRVWFMGATSATYSTKIFYSQLLTDIAGAGKCYQAGDPTSEHFNSVVDTDGGVINIPAIGEVVAAEVVGSKLVIFATNGVWQVGGGEGQAFIATSISVDNISNVGVPGANSLVVAAGTPFYWADQGIYFLKKDEISNNITADTLSWDRIQSLYDDIPEVNKSYAVGKYNDITKRVYWFYATDPTYTYRYNKVLILDLRLQAFYKYSIDDTNAHVIGVTTTRTYADKEYKIKMLTNTGVGLTFSEFNNANFLDWYTYDLTGVDAAGYLDAGYETLGDPSRKKQGVYMHTWFKRTEANWVLDGSGDLVVDNPSGCTIRFKWDWANSSVAKNWSRQYQIYRIRRPMIPTGVGVYDDGSPVVWTKTKVRGSGRALTFRFDTQPGKDCHILGWMCSFTGNVKQ